MNGRLSRETLLASGECNWSTSKSTQNSYVDSYKRCLSLVTRIAYRTMAPNNRTNFAIRKAFSLQFFPDTRILPPNLAVLTKKFARTVPSSPNPYAVISSDLTSEFQIEDVHPLSESILRDILERIFQKENLLEREL